MRTGWHPRNRSEAEFLNVRDNMPHSPGPTVDCIEYLIGKGIVLVPRMKA
jgi:kynurenine formamidase